MIAPRSANPWLMIWTKPRETIRNIIATNPSLYFLPLCAIYGFPILIHIAQFFAMGTSMPGWAILLLSLVLSPVAGFVGISFWAILLMWTGKWIGGKSNYMDIRASVAWSNMPNLVNSGLWLLMGLMLGTSLFLPGLGGDIMRSMAQFILIVSVLQLISMIWALVLLVITLSEVQGFSIWRSIANIAIPSVILIVLGSILNSILLGMQS